MRALVDYRALREQTLKKLEAAPSPHPGRSKVRAALAAAGSTVLSEWRARLLLDAYSIGGKGGMLARSVAEAEAAVKTIGQPVALKVQSPDIPHKTEAGAVALNIGFDDAGTTYERLLANAVRHVPMARIEGVLVQAMAPAGREVILGIHRDQRWGPLLMVGLGGILVETVRDVVLAPVPLDRDAALALLGRLAGAALLGPNRGTPEADTGALADLMVKLSQFAFDHAEDIAEIDLNPVIVHGKGDGVTVVDALIVKCTGHDSERHTAAE